ncbi:MAG: hypothetical protein R3337_14295, partial [Gammaproteobacteria bacterium]|nr:hypothetical protein [Gammaproteobacteria bacterium]
MFKIAKLIPSTPVQGCSRDALKGKTMGEYSASLAKLVDEMRRVTSERTDAGSIVNALSAPVRATALSKDWVEDRLFVCDPEQGFGVHVLHEE